MIKDYKPNNKGTKQLFENPVLEGLSRTNFWFPVSLYYVLSIVVLTYGLATESFNWWGVPLIFIIGLLSFSFAEYLIHRFIFHFVPKNDKQKKLLYAMHGVHHEFPRDKDRLVMPPVVSIILAIVFFFLFQLLIGKYAFIFFPGFASGYSTYLFIHYMVHAYRPPQNFLKLLWKHHTLHHYKDTDAAFAVSFPFWDILFKTMPENKKQQVHN
jgi:sterol desaturase/sphingolipid hydroxylase (fatty acid hydroxylase superfamily)